MVLRVVRILCSGFAMKTLGGRRSEEAVQMNQFSITIDKVHVVEEGRGD